MAGMKALLGDLVKVAMDVVDDIKVTVTYTRVSSVDSYDANSDTVATTNTPIIFQALLSTKSDNEYDYAKMPDDHLKLVVAAQDMPVFPTKNDKCVINSVTYEVKRIKYVPGDPLFIIYIQKT